MGVTIAVAWGPEAEGLLYRTTLCAQDFIHGPTIYLILLLALLQFNLLSTKWGPITDFEF